MTTRTIGALAALACWSASAAAQPASPSISRIEADAATVVVRQGANTAIRVVGGDAGPGAIRQDGALLVVDSHGAATPLTLEVVTPSIASLTARHGAAITASGFALDRLTAEVRGGGAIDLDQSAIVELTARVRDGGRIVADPSRHLAASVAGGGLIAYRSTPHVDRAIEGRGSIRQGSTAIGPRPLQPLQPAPSLRPAS